MGERRELILFIFLAEKVRASDIHNFAIKHNLYTHYDVHTNLVILCEKLLFRKLWDDEV